MKNFWRLLLGIIFASVVWNVDSAMRRTRLHRANAIYNLAQWSEQQMAIGLTITPEYQRQYPLHAAIMQDKDGEVSELTKNRDLINVKDPVGDTPLHAAAKQNKPIIMQKLISAGAVVDAKRNGYLTPLVDAINANCIECAKILLEAGANPDNSMDNRSTPSLLHWLVQRSPVNTSDDDKKIIRLLLSYGANPEIKDLLDKTVIDIARYWKNDALVALLENAVLRRELAKRKVVTLAIAWGLVAPKTVINEQLFEQLIQQHPMLRGTYLSMLGE